MRQRSRPVSDEHPAGPSQTGSGSGGENQILLDGGRLVVNGAVRRLRPKSLAVATYLIQHAGTIVGREQLARSVWPDQPVSDDSINRCISDIRRALSGCGKQVLTTVPKKGYVMSAAACADDSAMLQRPALMVIPFATQADDESLAFVGRALATELIHTLSTLRWLRVIARESSFRAQVVDNSQAAARQLGVAYLLSGQCFLAGGRVRIYVELWCPETASILWDGRYEGESADLQEMIDRTAGSITTALDSQIPRLESHVHRRQLVESLDAWGCYHRAFDLMHRFTREDNAQAAQLLARSIALAPDFCRAHAALSFTHSQNAFMGYTSDQKTALNQAKRFGERSVELDEQDPYAHFTVGRVYWFAGDVAGSSPHLEKALTLCPSFAQGYYARALVKALLDDGRRAAQDGMRAAGLSPLDPMRWAMHGAASLGYLIMGEYERALAVSESAANEPAAHQFMHAIAFVASDSVGDRSRKQHWRERMQSNEVPMTAERFLSRFPFRGSGIRSRVQRAFQ